MLPEGFHLSSPRSPRCAIRERHPESEFRKKGFKFFFFFFPARFLAAGRAAGLRQRNVLLLWLRLVGLGQLCVFPLGPVCPFALKACWALVGMCQRFNLSQRDSEVAGLVLSVWADISAGTAVTPPGPNPSGLCVYHK